MIYFQSSLIIALAAILLIIWYKEPSPMLYSYRVVPINPYTYEIQVLYVVTIGLFWWKRRKEKWCDCDCAGRPMGTIHRIQSEHGDYYTVFPKEGRFTNEAAAKRQIENFRRMNVLQSIPTVSQS